MSEYQPIYDAVRSKISNGDIGGAIERAMANSGFSHFFEMMHHDFNKTQSEMQRPSAIWRPKIYMDGNQWCALYGDNLQDGVAGFGDTPNKAMWDFDKKWDEKLECKIKDGSE